VELRVISADGLHGGLVGFDFGLEALKRRVCLIAVLGVRAPLFRSQAEKDAGADQRHFEERFPHQRASRVSRHAVLTADCSR
jgi:hypothetical protein